MATKANPHTKKFHDALKRRALMRQLETYNVTHDEKGVDIVNLDDHALARLIALAKIRKGL